MTEFPPRISSLQPFWGYWRLLETLGSGQYGRVYHIVRNDGAQTLHAALKWISLPKAPSELVRHRQEGMTVDAMRAYYADIVDGLRREIELMRQLRRSPRIVGYEDHMLLERTDSVGWDILIRMELLKPLPQIVSDGMTVGDVIDLGADICEGLEECRKCHIIHRDIKPDNLFVTPEGRYSIGDFGVARTLEASEIALSRQGTPIYMAPEVYRGEKRYDLTVDLYSLGLVLYRLLNQQRIPFAPDVDRPLTQQEQSCAMDRRIRGEVLPPPKDGGKALAQIILRACAYDPAQRFQTPLEMRDALLQVARRSPRKGRLHAASGAKAPRARKGNKRLILVTLALLLAAGVIAWQLPRGSIAPVNRTANGAAQLVAQQALLLDEPLVLPSAEVEAVVRTAVGKPTGELTAADAQGIRSLKLSGMGLDDIGFLLAFTGLRALDIGMDPATGITNTVTDISVLQSLTALTELYLSGNRVKDFSPLRNLKSVTVLDLTETGCSELTVLSELTQLQSLGLTGNGITDVSPLASLSNLQLLWLNRNQIQDVMPLAGLTGLMTLDLSGNQIARAAPLRTLVGLLQLDLRGNPIADAEALIDLQGVDLMLDEL